METWDNQASPGIVAFIRMATFLDVFYTRPVVLIAYSSSVGWYLLFDEKEGNSRVVNQGILISRSTLGFPTFSY